MFLTLSNKNIVAKWCVALDCEIAGRDRSNVSERGSLRRFKEEEGITLYRRLCCVWLRALLCSGKLCAGLWVRGALYADLNLKHPCRLAILKTQWNILSTKYYFLKPQVKSEGFYFGMWSLSSKILCLKNKQTSILVKTQFYCFWALGLNHINALFWRFNCCFCAPQS